MTRFSVVRSASLGLLIAGAACADGSPTSVEQPPQTLSDSLFAGVFAHAVSERIPVASAAQLGAAASSSSVTGVVYVAFATGELPTAVTVSVSNPSAGFTSLPFVMVDGGVDPFPVAANSGDTLRLDIVRADGSHRLMLSVVPPKRPPRVVRTNPPRGRIDIAVNASIEVVFSEPIDPASISNGAVHLSTAGTQAVPGTLSLRGPFTLVFTPLQPLIANTAYTLVIDGNVRNVNGTPTDSSVFVDFKTLSPTSGDLRVVVTSSGIDVPASYIAHIGTSNNPFSGPSITVPSNASATFENVTAGVYYLTLDGLADHCRVVSEQPRSVFVFAGTVVGQPVSVLCEKRGTADVLSAQQIAFSRGVDLYAVNVDGTAPVRLTNAGVNSQPVWSPDGTRIAFTSVRGGVMNIYAMAASDLAAVRRTSFAGWWSAADPAWLPGGLRIGYAGYWAASGSSAILASTSVSDTTTALVTDGPGYEAQPSWSPDGRKIAFTSDRAAYDFTSDIFTANADGSDIRQLTFGFAMQPYLTYYLHPMWSPDGSKIAFVYGRRIAEPNDFPVRFVVAVMDADGSNRRDLAVAGDLNYHSLLDPGAIAWSPDGTQIAFTVVDCDATNNFLCTTESPHSVWYVSIDGSRKGLIVSNGRDPSWRR